MNDELRNWEMQLKTPEILLLLFFSVVLFPLEIALQISP